MLTKCVSMIRYEGGADIRISIARVLTANVTSKVTHFC
jgi:hypothetical protein